MKQLTFLFVIFLFLAGCNPEQGITNNQNLNTEETVASMSVVNDSLWTYYNEKNSQGQYRHVAYGDPISADLYGNGKNDIVIPRLIGYSTGSNTSMNPVVLKNTENGFVYDKEFSNSLPEIPGLRRTEVLDRGTSNESIFGVQHETGTGKMADALYLKQGNGQPINSTDTLPTFPLSLENPYRGIKNNRNQMISSHALATGDITGNGLDDVLIGDYSWTGHSRMKVLYQTAPGVWEIDYNNEVLNEIQEHPSTSAENKSPTYALTMQLTDLDGDNAPDLIIGWQFRVENHSPTTIYYNDGNGNFSHDNKQVLPMSSYGNAGLNINIYDTDINNDGHTDLMLLYTRSTSNGELSYAGYDMELFINDGSGHMTMSEDHYFQHDPNRIKTHTNNHYWTDNFIFHDINEDGRIDLIASDGDGPRLWINEDGVLVEKSIDVSGANEWYNPGSINNNWYIFDNGVSNSVDVIHTYTGAFGSWNTPGYDIHNYVQLRITYNK